MQHHLDAEARRINLLLSNGLAKRQRMIITEVEENMAGNMQVHTERTTCFPRCTFRGIYGQFLMLDRHGNLTPR